MFLFRLLFKAAPLLLFLLFSRIMREAVRGARVPPGGPFGGAGPSGGPGSSGGTGPRRDTAGPGRARNPYSVLGCSPSASDDEVRRRYRELTARYHPDKFIGQKLDDDFVRLASSKFQEIQEAYARIRSARGI
ncbi:MAG: DnaJ domain-containing protein [Synergistota bacterium]|nr:DnaJ domain-containing protein [Synergistota bacterium]